MERVFDSFSNDDDNDDVHVGDTFAWDFGEDADTAEEDPKEWPDVFPDMVGVIMVDEPGEPSDRVPPLPPPLHNL